MAIIAMGLGALVSAALAVQVNGATALLAAAAIMAVAVVLLWHARQVDLRVRESDSRGPGELGPVD